MNTTRTPLFLMANLGSEMSRLFDLKERGEIELANKSAVRAINIAERIINDKTSLGAAKEAFVLKNIVEDKISEFPKYSIKKDELNAYFAPISIRALSISLN